MYRFLIVFILGITLIACKNNSDQLPTDIIQNPNTADGINKDTKTALVEFNKTMHEFGQVIQGEVVSYNFKITNKGNANLIITNVSTSCGCTVSEYPMDPIQPGETKKIKAIFDSGDRIGFQNKRITVLTNATPARHILKIKADVIKPGQ